MPLSGELFPLWVWLDEGLEVGWSKVEFEGEGWERGRGTGFTEVCSDCTGLFWVFSLLLGQSGPLLELLELLFTKLGTGT